ncbi:hypothetical protein [Syntrophobotulus glycolicus]
MRLCEAYGPEFPGAAASPNSSPVTNLTYTQALQENDGPPKSRRQKSAR